MPDYKPIKPVRRNAARQAFTLVEIMVVVLIISVILNMALPSFIQARNNTQTKACMENLRHIQDAKQEWAIVQQQPGTATPTWSNLAPDLELNGATQLYCPTQGGTYTINEVDQVPVCNQYPLTHDYDGT